MSRFNTSANLLLTANLNDLLIRKGWLFFTRFIASNMEAAIAEDMLKYMQFWDFTVTPEMIKIRCFRDTRDIWRSWSLPNVKKITVGEARIWVECVEGDRYLMMLPEDR